MVQTTVPHRRTVALPAGESVPAFGLGTWHMGENRGRYADEVAALKLGIELGITLIDTAEMYGNGVAEEIVAEAMGNNRDKLFIVSKVLPYNASRQGTIEACERSLKRLKTDRIDLYLLHWTGSHPFAETLAGFERLKEQGKIRHHGVSNFDRSDMEKWYALAGGNTVASNQILYNLNRRGPEFDLIPWCRERSISIMAYSPVDQGRMLGHKALVDRRIGHDRHPQGQPPGTRPPKPRVARPQAHRAGHRRRRVGPADRRDHPPWRRRRDRSRSARAPERRR